MSETPLQQNPPPEFTICLLEVAAGMIGVCMTGVGIIHLITAARSIDTMADDILVLDSLIFLSCCVCSFLNLKTQNPRLAMLTRTASDLLFLVGLVLLVIVSIMIVYSIV